MRKVKTRMPSGKVKIRENLEKPRFPVCAMCRKPMHGMKRENQAGLRKFSKTEKRPSRLYGGYLCANCTKELVRIKARMI
jgi:large subunit ribosomal protein L34e